MNDYKHKTNAELESLVKEHMDALYEIRRELDRRKNQSLPKTDVDFTTYVTK